MTEDSLCSLPDSPCGTGRVSRSCVERGVPRSLTGRFQRPQTLICLWSRPSRGSGAGLNPHRRRPTRGFVQHVVSKVPATAVGDVEGLSRALPIQPSALCPIMSICAGDSDCPGIPGVPPWALSVLDAVRGLAADFEPLGRFLPRRGVREPLGDLLVIENRTPRLALL